VIEREERKPIDQGGEDVAGWQRDRAHEEAGKGGDDEEDRRQGPSAGTDT
jgi:hypothetical protein